MTLPTNPQDEILGCGHDEFEDDFWHTKSPKHAPILECPTKSNFRTFSLCSTCMHVAAYMWTRKRIKNSARKKAEFQSLCGYNCRKKLQSFASKAFLINVINLDVFSNDCASFWPTRQDRDSIQNFFLPQIRLLSPVDCGKSKLI